MEQLLSPRQVKSAMGRLLEAVAKSTPADQPLAVIGIRTRGEILARRMVEALRQQRPGQSIEFGVLDITFYRDDISLRSLTLHDPGIPSKYSRLHQPGSVQ